MQFQRNDGPVLHKTFKIFTHVKISKALDFYSFSVTWLNLA